jgi:hypothetical protein
MTYWIVIAVTAGNMTCNPSGVGCDLRLPNPHYQTLEDCRKEAPWAVGNAVDQLGEGVDSVRWRCQKIGDNSPPRPPHGVLLQHRNSDDDE